MMVRIVTKATESQMEVIKLKIAFRARESRKIWLKKALRPESNLKQNLNCCQSTRARKQPIYGLSFRCTVKLTQRDSF